MKETILAPAFAVSTMARSAATCQRPNACGRSSLVPSPNSCGQVRTRFYRLNHAQHPLFLVLSSNNS